MNDYFKHVPYILSSETKHRILKMAMEEEAFMDNSYGIPFFKHPTKLEKLNINIDCRLQLLKQVIPESKIHKDKNRMNEFDNVYMPRTTVINYPILGEGETHFYDDNKEFICKTNYNNNGAILNTGGKFHNVIVTKSPRIVFQLCFDLSFDDVVKYHEEKLKNVRYI